MSEKNTAEQPTGQSVEVIDISKSQYITTEEDLQQGMERTIPLDKLRCKVNLELALPIDKDGKTVTHIEINPPKTLDVKRWRSTPNPMQSVDEFIIKCLKHWAPTDLDLLEPYDYLRVQKIVMHFL